MKAKSKVEVRGGSFRKGTNIDGASCIIKNTEDPKKEG